MDGDTGHIKMTRGFRTSIITQLHKIKKNFLTPNGKFNQKFYKKKMEHVRFIIWHISPYLYIISGVWLDWHQCGNRLALCYFAVVMELPDSL